MTNGRKSAGLHGERTGSRNARRVRQRGSEAIEFTLALLPLLAMIFVLMDTAWAVFAKSTLQRAVRVGVRAGVTITAAQAPQGSCLTDMVKSAVQQNSLGILNGDDGLAKIKVHYFRPPAPGSTADAVDVSTQSNANAPGNIMHVSVDRYSLLPLVPRIFDWSVRPDSNPLRITVSSADRIEPSRNPPCKGTAP